MESIWVLRRISILSAMKVGCTVAGAFGFFIGTIWGITVAFFSSMLAMVIEKPSPVPGVLAVFIMPVIATVIYTVLGAVLSFLFALFYNLAAGIMGGIEFEMDLKRKEDTTYMNFEL